MALFSGVSKMSACEILALINALAVALSDDLSNEDINALGNLIVSIGSVMLTIGALTDEEQSTPPCGWHPSKKPAPPADDTLPS